MLYALTRSVCLQERTTLEEADPQPLFHYEYSFKAERGRVQVEFCDWCADPPRAYGFLVAPSQFDEFSDAMVEKLQQVNVEFDRDFKHNFYISCPGAEEFFPECNNEFEAAEAERANTFLALTFPKMFRKRVRRLLMLACSML